MRRKKYAPTLCNEYALLLVSLAFLRKDSFLAVNGVKALVLHHCGQQLTSISPCPQNRSVAVSSGYNRSSGQAHKFQQSENHSVSTAKGRTLEVEIYGTE